MRIAITLLTALTLTLGGCQQLKPRIGFLTAGAELEPSAGVEPSAGKEPSAELEPSASKEPLAGKEPSAGVEPPTVPESATAGLEQAPAAPNVDLWQRMRSGFRLSPETDRRRVQTEMRWYLNHPDYLERVSTRAEPHLHYIIEEIEKRDLPLEFALLPIVESAYDPFAYSHGRAAGLWQFIPATARVYGLKIDWWYDGRRDVRASTQAALDYLEHLHKFFKGDSLLALAAYNAGEGNVLKSIRASGQRRDQADFWTLKVFRETYTYVPKLLALAEIVRNPAQHGIKLRDLPNQPVWQAVDTNGQIDLHKVAELSGLSPKEVYHLNPGFNQWATHPDGPHQILLPLERVENFKHGLTNLSQSQRVSWQRHRVRSGESLSTIAQKYNTTVATIRQINELKGSMIKTGSNLLIPTAAEGVQYSMTAESRLASKQDSLKRKYGAKPVIHIVQEGESFWEIARKYDVGMRQLAKWNGMGTASTLRVGTELKVFKQTSLETSLAGLSKPEQIRKLSYRVREGESLSLIANKFNVTVRNIKKWNQSLGLQKYIHPGDYLTLYVDVTALIN